MKILFVLPAHHQLFYGGAEVQFKNTVKNVNKYLSVEIYNHETTDIKSFDLVHLFRLSESHIELCNYLIENNIPYVVSPIFFPQNLLYLLYFKITSLFINFKFSKISSLYYKSRILNNAKIIFPNTYDENKLIKKISHKCNTFIIPNCVDDEFYTHLHDTEISNIRRFNDILCVGRIEPRKGQLVLLKCAKHLNLKITTIGNIRDQSYFNNMLSLNYDKWTHIDHVSSRKELICHYYSHKYYIQPSSMETPGISAMEALLCGCKLAICSKGGTFEYFKNNALYIKDQTFNEVCKVVINMLSNQNVNLSCPVFERYDDIALQYCSAYNSIKNSDF